MEKENNREGQTSLFSLMWKLGNYQIEGKVVLGPMAGFTSSGYREFMDGFGVDVSVTEMVSDMGLFYGNKETKSYITYDNINSITGVQLFGNDPEAMKRAALISLNINKDIQFFDINMGCPVPKVTKTGAGSSLLKDPKLCGEIVRAIKSVTSLPVTAKIRLGWDEKSLNFLEVIHELEAANVDMIAIHARSKKQLYSGEPNFEILRDLREKMHVPLVISGNIYTLDDAIKAIEITKADAVMVARGGIGNPYLCTQINEYFKTGKRLENPTLDDQIKWCVELADFLIEEKGEAKAMMIYRSIAPRFFTGFPNAKQIKVALATKLVSRDSLLKILEEYRTNLDI